jgi:hypothetical protein
MNTVELPLTFATAGLVGLGGLAFLMGAVLSLVAELLAVLRGHRNWARGNAKSSGRSVVRHTLPGPRAASLVTTVLAWQNGSGADAQHPDGDRREPRAAA